MKNVKVDLTKKTQNSLFAIGGVSLIGSILSIWQTWLFHQTRSGVSGFDSFCNIGNTFDCTSIEMSPYSEIFGGYPVSILAVAAYFLMGIVALFGLQRHWYQSVRITLRILTTVAVLSSLYYLWVMVAVIGKGCVLCLGVDAINLVLLILALSLPGPATTTKTTMQFWKGPVLITGICTVAIALLFNLGLNPNAEQKRDDIEYMIERIMTSTVENISLPTGITAVGPADAPVTLVKFSDYECPSCKLGAQAIHPLMKRYPNQVRFVFVNFPLSQECNPEIKSRMHVNACEAAAVAICADQQGQFTKAYETLFDHQGALVTGKIPELLKVIPEIDQNKLMNCVKSGGHLDALRRDLKLATDLKIDSTPTFFLNGKRIKGGLPTSLWIEVIDQTLKQK